LEEKTLGRPNHELQDALPYSLSGPQSSVAFIHDAVGILANNAGAVARKCRSVFAVANTVSVDGGRGFRRSGPGCNSLAG